mmetsp:Transcript_46534/g.72818  ORF Transcript_46534/g.72818 Transcript_46534/m.72818 type:complete len:422 (+) Transcript_46534:3-1268(+)|eukprot:CAMPEP_0184304752 /NCGR_PEP_ID=MMETSP1049-20130417/14190_1 /TAXON_ID=77928 /ORGANISM="Proteomonas sulcata, Strain CCMP704" /LENGTH=421 /DNA_ID=CAMNT_0026616631 /DNA_START=1 /DNA_END=1266 /DNA_ORIENTATION=+
MTLPSSTLISSVPCSAARCPGFQGLQAFGVEEMELEELVGESSTSRALRSSALKVFSANEDQEMASCPRSSSSAMPRLKVEGDGAVLVQKGHSGRVSYFFDEKTPSSQCSSSVTGAADPGRQKRSRDPKDQEELEQPTPGTVKRKKRSQPVREEVQQEAKQKIAVETTESKEPASSQELTSTVSCGTRQRSHEKDEVRGPQGGPQGPKAPKRERFSSRHLKRSQRDRQQHDPKAWKKCMVELAPPEKDEPSPRKEPESIKPPIPEFETPKVKVPNVGSWVLVRFDLLCKENGKDVGNLSKLMGPFQVHSYLARKGSKDGTEYVKLHKPAYLGDVSPHLDCRFLVPYDMPVEEPSRRPRSGAKPTREDPVVMVLARQTTPDGRLYLAVRAGKGVEAAEWEVQEDVDKLKVREFERLQQIHLG